MNELFTTKIAMCANKINIVNFDFTRSLRCPYYGLRKVLIFKGFGSPQQQVDIHARSKNTFIVL